ncbi:hypothetical protein LTSEADE_2031 [Salmonella enterica subsp. enterica serovar Adelaide str. A4-669]|uniref:LuxR family transcriptional regulator n=1 Tax=Salmonella enterica subsp. enterica serovar Adelaide str. A4-669 TaxID=913063 RepID=A0A6C8GP44_SALET|nr:hypothetical protein LTSEADE_2031 [Salmonella enterica subsp. enterica serovar Adelaide str. A4-669]
MEPYKIHAIATRHCVDFIFYSISDESVETRLKLSIPVNTISSYFHT